MVYGNAIKFPVYDPEISVERYFRYAQDQRNMRRYRIALVYYDIIIENFSNDQRKVITAEYEKGYIYYSMGRFSKALEIFNLVSSKAENPVFSPYVPQSVSYLARDFVREINEKLHSKEAKKHYAK